MITNLTDEWQFVVPQVQARSNDVWLPRLRQTRSDTPEYLVEAHRSKKFQTNRDLRFGEVRIHVAYKVAATPLRQKINALLGKLRLSAAFKDPLWRDFNTDPFPPPTP